MRTGIAIVLMLLLAACEPSAENAIAPPTPATEAADLVIRDARVYTLNPQQPWAEALAAWSAAL